MANKRTINLELLAKNNTGKAFKSVGDDASRLGSGLSKVGVGIGIAFAAAAAGVIRAGFEAVESLKRIEVIGAQTNAVIKSTGGVAGVTAEQIVKMADALERTTATESESIQEGANLLLTFTNIRNGLGKNEKVFDRATALMVDMARAMGTDAKDGAIQLGKALNDPIDGVASLTRVGVQFTDQQKDLIKSLVESGDVMGAQTVILDELQTQFGGSGAAYADTFAGQIDTLNHRLGGLTEGVVLSLMPALEDMVSWGNSDLIPWLQGFADWFVSDGVPALKDFVGWIVQYRDILGPAATALGILTVAQYALNVAMAANPVGLVILGLGLLVAAGVALATNWDAVGVAIVGATNWMLSTVTGNVNALIGVLQGLLGPFNAILATINALTGTNFAQIRLPTLLTPQFAVNPAGAAGGRTGGRSGPTGLANRANGVPAFADGGLVRGGRGGVLGLIGEKSYDELVLPLKPGMNLGAGTSIVIQVSGSVGSEDQLAKTVVRAIQNAQSRGQIPRGALA